MRVADTKTATATLDLKNVRTIATLPTTTVARNAVTGLLNTAADAPTCRAVIGAAANPLQVQLQQARGSSLSVECPVASTLTATNINGQCLQLVYPRAATINTSGNRSIVIHIDPANPPTTIDVSGTMSPGPTNTPIVVRLSLLQSDRASASGLTIRGRLQTVFAANTPGVIVHGCGASTVDCRGVMGIRGFAKCRSVEKCVTDRGVAMQALTAAVTAADPCKTP